MKEIIEHEYNEGINERVNSEISELSLKVRLEFLEWCKDYGHITERDSQMLWDDIKSISEE